mgnify:CR=1 FL=1
MSKYQVLKKEFIYNKQTGDNTMPSIDIEREAKEYFDHNPDENIVGFALLTGEQVLAAQSYDEIPNDVTVLEVVLNDDIRENVRNKYMSKSNLTK